MAKYDARIDYIGTLWNKPQMTAEVRESMQETARFAREILPPATPKKTGRMSQSWDVSVGDRVLRIRNAAPYSLFVENGTVKMKARPTLAPAIPKIEAHFKSVLSDKVEAKLGINSTKPNRALARSVASLRGIVGAKSKPVIKN